MGFALAVALRYLRSKKRNMISISGALAVGGGFAMGICFAIVFVVAVAQLWLFRRVNNHA